MWAAAADVDLIVELAYVGCLTRMSAITEVPQVGNTVNPVERIIAKALKTSKK